MRNRGLLGAGVALAVAFGGVQAHAQFFGPYPPGAFYLGPEGGWTQLSSQNDKFAVPAKLSNFLAGPKATFNSGFNAGARGGYEWGPWRFEEEFSYRNNGASNFADFGKISGERRSDAIMTNVIYDFTFGWPITPHIGAGVGAVDVIDGVSATGAVPAKLAAVLTSPSLNGDSWTFGYQGIAGIRYNINPALALDIDYRYLATTDVTLKTGGKPRRRQMLRRRQLQDRLQHPEYRGQPDDALRRAATGRAAAGTAGTAAAAAAASGVSGLLRLG